MTSANEPPFACVDGVLEIVCAMIMYADASKVPQAIRANLVNQSVCFILDNYVLDAGTYRSDKWTGAKTWVKKV